MKFKAFLDLTFHKIRNSFPAAVIEYELKENTGIHFLKVTPESLHKTEGFIDLYYELTDLFYENQYEGDFCIIAKDNLAELNPSRISKPKTSVVSSEIWSTSEPFNFADVVNNLSFKNIAKNLLNIQENIKLITSFNFDLESPLDLKLTESFDIKESIHLYENINKSISPNLIEQKAYDEERMNDHEGDSYEQLAMAA